VRSDSGRSVNLVIFWFLVFGFWFLPKRPMAVGGRTLESGSSARHASRTASEICGVDDVG